MLSIKSISVPTGCFDIFRYRGLREGLARGLRGTSIAWKVIVRLIYGNNVTGENVLGYDPQLLNY